MAGVNGAVDPTAAASPSTGTPGLPSASPLAGGVSNGVDPTTGLPTAGTASGTGQGTQVGNPLAAQSQFSGSTQGNQQLAGQAQTGAANQLNQYTAGQQALQNTLPGLLSGILTGTSTIPSTFTAPQAAFTALNDNFNQYVAPQIAAEYGGGSPQIAAQAANANEQLAGNLYQTGQANFNNYLNTAGTDAFNAVGQQSANTAAGNSWQNANQQQQGYSTNSPLGVLGQGGAAAGSILSQLSALLGIGGSATGGGVVTPQPQP